MTLTRQVQPQRLRRACRTFLQSVAALSILLGFVLWASAFAKRLEEADLRAREAQLHAMLRDVNELQEEVRRLRDCQDWRHVTWARCLP